MLGPRSSAADIGQWLDALSTLSSSAKYGKVFRENEVSGEVLFGASPEELSALLRHLVRFALGFVLLRIISSLHA